MPKFLYRAIGWSPARDLVIVIGQTRGEAIARLRDRGASVLPHPRQRLGIWSRGTKIERLEKGVDFRSRSELPLPILEEGMQCR